mmetsp:Transcript_40825/g.100802  ORF Transcript_40825/g.100802 Transcript_40825/m.100802 type:complete len:90 (+) Transcript_40825:38-307(+)
MPCGYCHGVGHNRRTCQRFNAQEYADMIASGVAKEAIYRTIDMAMPGVGLALQAIELAFNAIELASRNKKMDKNERYRKALGLLHGVSN